MGLINLSGRLAPSGITSSRSPASVWANAAAIWLRQASAADKEQILLLFETVPASSNAAGGHPLTRWDALHIPAFSIPR